MIKQVVKCWATATTNWNKYQATIDREVIGVGSTIDCVAQGLSKERPEESEIRSHKTKTGRAIWISGTAALLLIQSNRETITAAWLTCWNSKSFFPPSQPLRESRGCQFYSTLKGSVVRWRERSRRYIGLPTWVWMQETTGWPVWDCIAIITAGMAGDRWAFDYWRLSNIVSRRRVWHRWSDLRHIGSSEELNERIEPGNPPNTRKAKSMRISCRLCRSSLVGPLVKARLSDTLNFIGNKIVWISLVIKVYLELSNPGCT